MFGLQPAHLVLIIVIALIIFGPSRLPELGRAMGRTITEFKNSTREAIEPAAEVQKTIQQAVAAPAPQPAAPNNPAPAAENPPVTSSPSTTAQS